MVLSRPKVTKHFTTDIGDDHLRYARNRDSITAEAALDGIYVLRPSVQASDLDSTGVVSSYKALPRSSGPSAPPIPTWTSGPSGTAPKTGSGRTCSCGCCRTTSAGTCTPGSPAYTACPHDRPLAEAVEAATTVRPPANHLDQATAAHLPGHKTAKAMSASNADAESK